MQKTQNFRIWGYPSIHGSGEKIQAMSVRAIKIPRGNLIGGSRSFSPENNKAASAMPIKILQIAMENTMDAAAPKVNQRAARDMNDSGGFIEIRPSVWQSHGQNRDPGSASTPFVRLDFAGCLS